jgi:hypothetical protein
MGGPGSGRRKRIEGITTPKYPACEKTSSYTPIKQKKFEAILKTHLWIVRNIQRQPKFKNFGKEGFAYFDLMAGPGKAWCANDIPVYFKPNMESRPKEYPK